MNPVRLALQNGFIDLIQSPSDSAAYIATYTVVSEGESHFLCGKTFTDVPSPKDAQALAVAWIATCYKEITKERAWLKKADLI